MFFDIYLYDLKSKRFIFNIIEILLNLKAFLQNLLINLYDETHLKG